MRVSILLPIFNAAPWLRETIQSIQSQSTLDWELICINDFSTDGSEAIIQEFDSLDPRIKLFSNLKKGIIPALQLALSKSTGEYITRMDADDLMAENRLMRMSEKLDVSPEKSIITGKVCYFSEGSLSEGFLKYQDWINDRNNQQDHFKHIYRECVVASPNWMMRRDELVNSNIFNCLIYPEDYDLVFHWRKNGFKIHTIDDVTLLWRDHPTRISKNSETYNQEALFKLKIDWFMKSRDSEKSLAILGAGTKGKITSRLLEQHNQSFRWHDFKHEKYRGKVNHTIETYTIIDAEELLITIYPDELTELELYLFNKGYIIGENAWYV